MARAGARGKAKKPRTREAVSATDGQGMRRAEILGVAARIFAEKGFATSTIRDIATEAGILSGSLYYHFDSKEAMVVEILDSAFGSLMNQYADLSDTDDLHTRIETLIMIGFEFTVQNPHAAAIIHNDYAQWRHDDKFRSVNDKYDAIREVWLTVLRRAQEIGLMRSSIDVKLAYRTMMGGIFSTTSWFDPAGRLTIEDVARGQMQIFLGGILHTEASDQSRPAAVNSAEVEALKDENANLKALLADAVLGKLVISPSGRR